MKNMDSGTRWLVVAFLATALGLANTFFLEGNVQIFAYIIIGMGVALFAIFESQREEKEHNG